MAARRKAASLPENTVLEFSMIQGTPTINIGVHLTSRAQVAELVERMETLAQALPEVPKRSRKTGTRKATSSKSSANAGQRSEATSN